MSRLCTRTDCSLAEYGPHKPAYFCIGGDLNDAMRPLHEMRVQFGTWLLKKIRRVVALPDRRNQ